MTEPSGVPTEDGLAGSLYPITRALLSRTARPSENWGIASPPGSLAELRTVVRTMYPVLFQESPLAALEAALERAITAIGDEDLAANGTHIKYASALRLLCGLEEVPEAGEGKRYDAVIAVIKDSSGASFWPPTQANALTAGLRRRLAQSLLHLHASLTKTQAPRPADSDHYVARAELSARIRERPTQDRDVLVLWGESGNGKSVMARQLASLAQTHANSVALVHGPNHVLNPRFASDIHAAVTKYGLDNSGYGFQEDLSAFASLLARPHSFEMVVLDDVDLPTLQLLLSEVAVPVVVTTRHKLPDALGTQIRVGAMEPAEALQLANRNLATSDQQQVALLTRVLGERPLPIELAARLVASGSLTLPDLLASLQTSAARTLTATELLAGESASGAIVDVYRQVLGVCDRTAAVRQVLDSIVWLVGEGPTVLLDAYLLDEASPEALLPLELSGALTALDSLGIIIVADEYISTNALTRMILRELTLDRIADVHRGVYDRVIGRGRVAAQDLFRGQILWDEFINESTVQGNPAGTIFCYTAASGEYARLLVTPSHDYGVYCVSDRVWAVYQQGHEFFAPVSAGEAQHALVTVDDDAIRLWTPRGSQPLQGLPLERFKLESKRFRDRLRTAYTRMVAPAEMLRDSTAWGARDALGRSRVDSRGLDLFVYAAVHEQHHDTIGRLPEFALRELEITTWSRCGALLSPDQTPPQSEEAQCPICVLDRSSGSRHEHTLEAARQLLAECDGSNVWHFLAMLYDVLAAYSSNDVEKFEYYCMGIDVTNPGITTGSSQAMAYSIAFQTGLFQLMLKNAVVPASMLEVEDKAWRRVLTFKTAEAPMLRRLFWTLVVENYVLHRDIVALADAVARSSDALRAVGDADHTELTQQLQVILASDTPATWDRASEIVDSMRVLR